MVDMDRLQEKETEHRALEQAALAEFLASKGISAAAETPSEPAQEEIGPAQADV